MLLDYRSKGAELVIVSPSAPLVPAALGIPIRITGPQRRDNLLAAARDYPADLKLYISDNGDLVEADAAGFIYIDRAAFR
jgi:hypothetical protein